MDRVFQARDWFTVPDGTDVAAFLNATDVTNSQLPWNALGEVSIAAGRIAPKSHSWIHVHPIVSVVTYLMSGSLSVWMKDEDSREPYSLQIAAGQAAVAEPRTLFQLCNDGDVRADVLYIVSPSYVFEQYGSELKYDDAILVARDWDELKASGYDVPALKTSAHDRVARREEAKRRLALMKGVRPPRIADEPIHTLAVDYDYLAPDGSEIRLLISGDHGGFAHCLLPAGRTSAAVRHRTVEELWYVLEGKGEVWRARDGEAPRSDRIRAGDSLRIPVGIAFQFRADPDADLKLLLATMPPWPGAEEAVATRGGWDGNVQV